MKKIDFLFASIFFFISNAVVINNPDELCVSFYQDGICESSPESITILPLNGSDCYVLNDTIPLSLIVDDNTDPPTYTWYANTECIPPALVNSNDPDVLFDQCQWLFACRFLVVPGRCECGDGFVNDGEECDDGNLLDNDGCSSNCTIELPNCTALDNCTCDGGCVHTLMYYLDHNIYETNCDQRFPWPKLTLEQINFTETLDICDVILLYANVPCNCSTNETLYDILNTVSFELEIQLRQQYILTLLNIASGACEPENMETILESVASILHEYCLGTNFSMEQLLTIENYLLHLENYNTGNIVGPEICPPEPFDCGDHCGCSFSKGYWKDSRYIALITETLTLQQRGKPPGYNHSVEDTCRWPDNNETEVRSEIACFKNSTQKVDWWSIEQLNNCPNNAFYNRDWCRTAQQLIAFALNIYNGLCSPCSNVSDFIQDDCEDLLLIFSETEHFIQNNSLDCKNTTWNDNCVSPACQSICAKYPWLFTGGCKYITVFTEANEGSIGPGHCVTLNNTNNTCCENCDYDPNKFLPGMTILTDVVNGGYETEHNSNWWINKKLNELSTLSVVVIVLLVVLIVILIIGCVWVNMTNKSKNVLTSNKRIAKRMGRQY